MQQQAVSEFLDWFFRIVGALALLLGGALMRTRDRSIKNTDRIDDLEKKVDLQVTLEGVRGVMAEELEKRNTIALQRRVDWDKLLAAREERMLARMEVQLVRAVQACRDRGACDSGSGRV